MKIIAAVRTLGFRAHLPAAILSVGLLLAPAVVSAQTVSLLAATPNTVGDFAPLGADVLTPGYYGTAVYRVTPGGALTTVGTFTAERGVTVGHDGAFYFTTSSGVVRFVVGGGNPTLFASRSALQSGITYHPGLNVYLVATQSNTILQISTSGAISTYFNSSVPRTFESVNVAPNGDLYVVSYTGEVDVISTSGVPVLTPVGKVDDTVWDIERLGNGDYLIAGDSGRITRMTPAGVQSTFATIPGEGLFRMQLINGLLYVGTFNGRIYTVTTPPTTTITGVSPASGPNGGGYPVVITGTNFTGATSVTFGGVPANSYTVNSATQITATVPAGTVGPVDIVVTTPQGTNPNTRADDFTYGAPSPTPVPTLSEWAMILFAAMLGGGASLYLQYRRRLA
ncbi:MAG: IPTL-CTERM sorting domain-containing protein [Pseudomonadota bacterium]|nr:IPTL-CTERM sorting domain-containing protein [Pseudomonadota bacterium]